MARNHNDGYVNLAVGEPFFLQDHLKFIHDRSGAGSLTYPLMNGQPELLEELKAVYGDKHIVVTNGAKQAILAVMYAYRELVNVQHIHHNAPYWPSYPTLAKLSELNFKPEHRGHLDILHFITSPNNPDGSELDGWSDEWHCVWDAAYASPVYGFSGKAPPHDAAIYSASKAFGLSGMRVGWVVTGDRDLAALISKYVEITTSGVCSTAQRYVADLFKYIRGHEREATEAFQNARNDLICNAVTFNTTIKKFCDEVHGVPDTKKGMFAWFKVKDHVVFHKALQQTKIRLVTGDACGIQDAGWYRMNCGLNSFKFVGILNMLERELIKCT